MDKLKHPVTWGIIATLAVAFFALWIGSAEHCFHDGACVSKFQLFLQADPNEVGDTLAGFAGALAFVWIIVTVWLQSNELAAQREELKLTRLEMEEQRKATQDMARAMAAQAEIAETERSQLIEISAKQTFDELLLSMRRTLLEHRFSWEGLDKNGNKWGELSRPIRHVEANNVTDRIFFLSYERSLESSCRKVTRYLKDGYSLEQAPSSDVFLVFMSHYRRVEKLFDQLSDAQKMRFQSTNIYQFKQAVAHWVRLPIWDERVK